MRRAIAEGGLEGLNKLIKTGALPAFLVAALFPEGADAAEDPMAPLQAHAQANIDAGTIAYEGGQPATVRSGSVNHPDLNNGRPTLIPFQWGGEILQDPDEAAQRAIDSGIQWPVFDTHEEATAASKGLSGSIQLHPDSPEYVGRLNEQLRQIPAPVDVQQQHAQGRAEGFAGIADIANVFGRSMFGGITGDIGKLGNLVMGEDIDEADRLAEEWMQSYAVPPKTAMGQEALAAMGGALSTAGETLEQGWEHLQDNSLIARSARDAYYRLPERARAIIQTTAGLVL